MENNETEIVRSEEEVRNDLVEQMNEMVENESSDPTEVSENGVGVDPMIIGGAIGAGAVAVVVGAVHFIKKRKATAAERKADREEHRKVKQDMRQAVKEILSDSKDKIKAIKHPVKETEAEAPVDPVEGTEESGKSSKKQR